MTVSDVRATSRGVWQVGATVATAVGLAEGCTEGVDVAGGLPTGGVGTQANRVKRQAAKTEGIRMAYFSWYKVT